MIGLDMHTLFMTRTNTATPPVCVRRTGRRYGPAVPGGGVNWLCQAVVLLCACSALFAQVDRQSAGSALQPVCLSSVGPWLRFDIAMGQGAGAFYNKVSGAEFTVQLARPGDDEFRTIWRARYGTHNQWYPCAVDISEYAGKTVRIRLMTSQLENFICCDYPYWGDPRVMVGPLDGTGNPEVVCQLAMIRPERMGGILPDGTIVPLDEEGGIFGYRGSTLVVPSMVNRQYSLEIYAGNEHITVQGPKRPGIYMGYDMSHDYVKYGGGRDQIPYRGPMPPPTFAQWELTIPPAPPVHAAGQAAHSGDDSDTTEVMTHRLQNGLMVLGTRVDTFAPETDLSADVDTSHLAFSASMGAAPCGWAFAGMELFGQRELSLSVAVSGDLAPRQAQNGFIGVVLDYHTPRGYAKRVFMGMGAMNDQRYDLRPADWYIDDASMTLAQRAGFVSEYVDGTSHLRNGAGRVDIDLADYAPDNWDGRLWISAGVQDLGNDATIKMRIRDRDVYNPNPTIPDLAWLRNTENDFHVMENDRLVLAVSGVNGALCGLWTKKDERRILVESSDFWNIEGMSCTTRVPESLDIVECAQVTDSPQGQIAYLRCRNPAQDDLVIEKTYTLARDGTYTKKVTFITTSQEGYFVKWDSLTRFDRKYLGSGYFGQEDAVQAISGRHERVAMSVRDPHIHTLQDGSYSFASYRLEANGRFVERRTGPKHYTNDGWILQNIFMDYVQQAQSVSSTIRWVLIKGDLLDFYRHYFSIPQIRALYELPTPPPQWVCELVIDGMSTHRSKRPMYTAIAPEPTTGILWTQTNWGDMGPHHIAAAALSAGNMDWSGSATIRGLQQAYPNVKFTHYHNYLFDDRSEIYRTHPEFGVRDRDGNLISAGRSNQRGMTSFYYQMANPQVRRFLLNWLREKTIQWNFDFIYFDGPGANAEVVDWGSRDVAQGYDWLEFYRGIYETIKAFRPVNGILFHNYRFPFARIGYIEYRATQWQKMLGTDWRSLAYELLVFKAIEAPGFVTVPTYGTPQADPALSAYTVFYGWCGNQGVIERLPWMRAAHEFRFMQLVPDAVGAKWWKDNDLQYEAAGFVLPEFRTGKDNPVAVVNVLGHDRQSPGAQDVDITVDPNLLGLRVGEPLYATLRIMTDATPRLEKTGKDRRGQPTYAGVYSTTTAYEDTPLIEGQPCPATLHLKVPVHFMRVSSCVLSHTPDTDLKVLWPADADSDNTVEN